MGSTDCSQLERDILEWNIPEEVLAVLLKDRTTGHNLIWATDDYVERGDGFSAKDEMRVEQIVVKDNPVIRPRVDKAAEEQRKRVEKRAEVFTPSWICNKQNNLVDAAWFNVKSKRVIGYVRGKDVVKNAADVKCDKVFIPGAYGAGEGFPHQILGAPEIAPKKSVCSQTYLYAKFGSHAEAVDFAAYLKTRFFRILVCAAKVTQHAQDRVYRFVPLQDFTSKSDIDWSRSVSELDAQLYAKYGITEPEQKFIESMIKPLE